MLTVVRFEKGGRPHPVLWSGKLLEVPFAVDGRWLWHPPSFLHYRQRATRRRARQFVTAWECRQERARWGED